MKNLGMIGLFASAAVAMGVVGCSSGSDKGSSSGLNSGVDSNKSVSEVTDAEAKKVCEAVNDYFQSRLVSRSFLLSVCRYAGASVAAAAPSENQAQEFCQLGYDVCVDCIDHPEQEGCEDFDIAGAVEDQNCDDASGDAPEDCDATVGEVEGCLQDTVDMFFDIFAEVPSCSKITGETSLPEIEVDETPATCQALEDSCPAVLED